MRLFKFHPLLKLVNSYVVDSPQPSNLSYWWNFGSLLALSLIIQIITGVTLAMHYDTDINEAFDSVENIMRDVYNGWLIRYLHSNTASAFFLIVYLHIGRGLYYGSYKMPRTLVWTIGTIIFILMMGTAFLGYVLPFGQMSLWGATVITSLMSAIPWIGQDIVEFLWGGFSVNHATLNRFFALHFVLPFILAALALMHLISLHDKAGSGNPLGISSNPDRLPFHPYFIFKDLITIFIYILVLSIFVFYMPNVLGDSENYVMANSMQTPSAIVPEWYLLAFYAILRSIPNKLLGVIAMFSAILMLLVLAFADMSTLRGVQFKPLSKIMLFLFVIVFLVLTQLGGKHVESPFIELGQVCTIIYFAYFLIIVPYFILFENLLSNFSIDKSLVENTIGEHKENNTNQIYAIPKNVEDNKKIVEKIKEIKKVEQIETVEQFIPHPIKVSTYGIAQSSLLGGYILNKKYTLANKNDSWEDHKLEQEDWSGYPESSSDAPRPWGIYFQDSGTSQMEILTELHDNILFYLIIILFGVGWLLVTIINKFNNMAWPLSQRFTSHGTTIEIIWTITPGIILILIAFPSFKLLYLMDEITDPIVVINGEGHQWYWSYQYIDFKDDDSEIIEFDSYLVPEADLQPGGLRMLEVDNRLVLPELTHMRFVVSGADVIHSFACPALGLKCDAYPGRMNQSSLMINRLGTFFGQCSEICGLLHSSMPIVFEAVSVEKFIEWVRQV